MANFDLNLAPGIYHYSFCEDFIDEATLYDLIEDLSWEAAKDDNEIVRYESEVLESLSFGLGFNDLVSEIHKSINKHFNCKLNKEIYIFKYPTGGMLPWHYDGLRHACVFLFFFGNFTGGSFKYMHEGDIFEIFLERRDILVSIQKDSDLQPQRIKHMVTEITSGTRYVLSVSFTLSRPPL